MLKQSTEQSALTPTLLWSFLDQEDQINIFLAFRCSQSVWKQAKYTVKMVADPDPLSHVLHDSLQCAIPVCEGSNLSNVRQTVSCLELRILLLEGKNALGQYTFSDGASFQKNGDAVCTADKTEGKAAYPRPCAASITLLWVCNLLYDVNLDGEWGSKVYLNKQVVFVIFLVL